MKYILFKINVEKSSIGLDQKSQTQELRVESEAHGNESFALGWG
jgi:hypothetical protein